MFLDCGNLDRMPVSFLGRDDAHIVNIDHHHDNTRFGTANLVVDGASCTAEIIWELLPDLGVELTPEIAEALYIGLVTDTGKFQYENTTPNSHRMAGGAARARGGRARHLPAAVRERAVRQAAAAGAGADPGRALRRRATDAVATSCARDYEETGADENYSEGLVDHMRALEGTVVGRARARAAEGGPRGRDEGQPARVGRCGRRERDRAQGGRRRAPPGRRILDHAQPAPS